MELTAYGVIDSSYPEELRKELKRAPKDEPIELSISSPGGSLAAGVTAYNLLRNTPQRVKVQIEGDCFSAATLLAAAGDEVEMPNNALMMIHDPWLHGLVPAGIPEIEKALKYLRATKRQAVEIYKQRTGLSSQKLARMMKEETYFTADEALDNGFVTNVIDAVPIQNLKIDDYPVKRRDHLASLLAERPVPIDRYALLERLAEKQLIRKDMINEGS